MFQEIDCALTLHNNIEKAKCSAESKDVYTTLFLIGSLS